MIRNSIAMTLNQFFYALAKYFISNRMRLAERQTADLLKKFVDLLEEKFARIEEKSTSAQSENSVARERLFLKLIFTFMSTIENKRPELRDLNRTLEMYLFSLARTRFKCLNSSVSATDCELTSAILADYSVLLGDVLRQTRGVFERG